MPELSWRHHAIIQALLSRGPLEEKAFHTIFTGLTGKNAGGHEQLFNDFLLKINKALSYVQFELRGCRNQYDGRVFYGVVNTVSDEQSKLGTKYSVPQIAFYKAIIEAIVQDATAQGSISNFDVLNIRLENQVLNGMLESQGGPYIVPPAFRNFSISHKEKTLDELVQDQWLYTMPDGNIGLGVRSFLDLRSWFRHNDVPSCEVCNEAGVKADLCQNEGCTVRIHRYCLKKKFSKRGERVCPSCGSQWLYQETKAEAKEEEEDEDEPNVSTQRQPPPGPKRKRLRTNTTNGADFIESSSSQAPLPSSGLRRTTRNSVRPR